MKGWRVNLIFILIILFGAAIISRLIYIQIIQHNLYRALAQGQQRDFQPLKGDRGEIFFKDGQILATNIREKYLFISPIEIKEKEETAKKLSQILNFAEEPLLEKIKKDSAFKQRPFDRQRIGGNLPRDYVQQPFPWKTPKNRLFGAAGNFYPFSCVKKVRVTA